MTKTMSAPPGFLGVVQVNARAYTVGASGTISADDQDVRSLQLAGFLPATGPTGPTGPTGYSPPGATGPTGPASGGETSMEWFFRWSPPDSALDGQYQPDAGDKLVMDVYEYTFTVPNAEDPRFTGTNEIVTHAESTIPGNQNFLLNQVNTIATLIAAFADGLGILYGNDTQQPDGLQVDLDSYSSLYNAILADPDQSDGPWPALRVFAEYEFTCSVDVAAVAHLTVATS